MACPLAKKRRHVAEDYGFVFHKGRAVCNRYVLKHVVLPIASVKRHYMKQYARKKSQRSWQTRENQSNVQCQGRRSLTLSKSVATGQKPWDTEATLRNSEYECGWWG